MPSTAPVADGWDVAAAPPVDGAVTVPSGWEAAPPAAPAPSGWE